MIAIAVDTVSGFTLGTPQLLFEGPYLPTRKTFPWYDVSLDGLRSLMLEPVESQTGATQINFALNWFAELKERLPTGNEQ